MEAMKKKQEEQQFQIQEILESQKNQFTLLKQRPETGDHTRQQKIGVVTRTGGSDEDGKNDKPKDDIRVYKISNIIGTTDTDGNSKWQVVKKRGSSGTPTKDRVTAKKERQRPPAILVKVGKSSYSEVLRKLKTDGNVKVSAAGNAQNTRKTQAGDLLVELQRHSQDSTLIVEAISKVMEDSGAAKALEQMEKIAILDMDEQVEEDDIVESLGAA